MESSGNLEFRSARRPAETEKGEREPKTRSPIGQARRKGYPPTLRVLTLTTQATAMTATGKRAWAHVAPKVRNDIHANNGPVGTLAELEMARMPVALIANRLGVDGAAFKAWTARLDAVRNFEEPPPSNAEIMRKPLVEREHG